VEEIAISEFKAKCLAVLERIRKTRTPIRITRDGKPVAEVVPFVVRSGAFRLDRVHEKIP
jgi:prevent-host-death family protein